METEANITSNDYSFHAISASFMLAGNGLGIVKADTQRFSVGESLKGMKPVPETFASFWIKAPDVSATQPVKGKTSEDGKGKIYSSDADSVLGLFQAVKEGKPIQIGYLFKDGQKDFAMYGRVNMSVEDAMQVSSCMHELINLTKKNNPIQK